MSKSYTAGAAGLCARCGRPLTSAEVQGSEYQIKGRALCPECNIREANSIISIMLENKKAAIKSLVFLLVTFIGGILLIKYAQTSGKDGLVFLGWFIIGLGGMSTIQNIFSGWIFFGWVLVVFYILAILIAPIFSILAMIRALYMLIRANHGLKHAERTIENHTHDYDSAQEIIQQNRIENPQMGNSGAQSYSKEDVEYLTMYRGYLSDGDITDKERNRLDKYAQALGLSQERVRQLEEE